MTWPVSTVHEYVALANLIIVNLTSAASPGASTILIDSSARACVGWELTGWGLIRLISFGCSCSSTISAVSIFASSAS